MSSYNSREDEDFFGAIGRLAISWAHLEFGLDCMVEFLYYACDGKAVEPEIPRALQRKITFLRAIFKTIPIGEEATQDYLSLLDRIQTAAQDRHDIIHGVVVEMVERSGEAKMVRPIRNKDSVTKKEFKATTKSVMEAARDANNLTSSVFKWVSQAYDLIDELRLAAKTAESK